MPDNQGLKLVRTLLSAVRDAAFLTPQRALAWGLALLLTYLGVLTGLALQGLWFVDPQGQPTSVDFVSFWTSGFFAATHDAAAIYDAALYDAAEVAALGRPLDGLLPWIYPPELLLLTAPLSRFPYLVAWPLWSIGGAAFLVFGLARIVPVRLAIPLALAAPASLWCAVVGQTGFLTAGLMACALGVLERRTWLSGACVGLLTFKPQFGVLLPLFLLVLRQGRAFAGACLTVLALVAVSAAMFGVGAWRAFLASLALTSGHYLMAGGSAWFKLQSIYALLYRLTGDASVALWGHVALCAALLPLLVWLWTRKVPLAVKSAALVAASFLFTPYAYIYDAVLPITGVTLLIRDGLDRGFRPWDKALLCLAWACPVLFGLLGSLTAPAGCAIILWLAVRRASAWPAASGS